MSGGLHVKYPLFLSDLNEIYTLSTDFRKISNFTKIRSVGADLFHAESDGRKNMTKLTVAFRNFTKAPKNVSVLHVTPFHVHSTEKELLFLP